MGGARTIVEHAEVLLAVELGDRIRALRLGEHGFDMDSGTLTSVAMWNT